MRGKDLLYDLNFIDEDLIEEAGADEMPECFKKINKISVLSGTGGVGSKKSSRQRLMAAAACLMLAVGVTAAVSQTDLFGMLDTGSDTGISNELNDTDASASCEDDGLLSGTAEDEESAADSSVTENASASDAAEAADSREASDSDSAEKAFAEDSKSSDAKAASGQSAQAEPDQKENQSSGYASEGFMDESSAEANSAPDEIIVASPNPNAGSSGSYGSSNSSGAKEIIGSAELTSYLGGLDYSEAVSSMQEEYIIFGADGITYYVNLTEGIAENSAGMTVLTEEQKASIAEMLEH